MTTLRESITDLKDCDLVPDKEDMKAFEHVKNRQYFKLNKSKHQFSSILANSNVFREE